MGGAERVREVEAEWVRSRCVERERSRCAGRVRCGYRGGAEEVQSGCADLSRAQVNLRQHRIGGSTLRCVQNAQRRAHAQRVEAHVLARGAPPVAAHGHGHVQRT